MYKNEKFIQKEWIVVDLRELNHVIVSDAYFLFLQSDIIASILECKYISVINDTDFFYQWWVAVKNHEKFTIVSHHELEIVSVAFMSYQKSFLYVQCMMNMIFWSHKFFACCYIDNIIIFSKILQNHCQHLNMMFSLFDKLKIMLKKVKTHLEYLLIILLNQWVNDFNMIFLKKRIAILQDLSFLKILKNLEIYLNLIDWFWQYISYYVQWIKLLQNRKTALLHKNSTAEQTRKNYSKKTSILNVNKLKKKTFKFI